ncbi:hypothetical protein Sjap_013109 [Stephania japonica]|uniref:Uncharacterized protein n=1 Tax=Stephania japonica TaxID=461633 RepID=A0AAP0IX54_9MAGN
MDETIQGNDIAVKVEAVALKENHLLGTGIGTEAMMLIGKMIDIAKEIKVMRQKVREVEITKKVATARERDDHDRDKGKERWKRGT